jgi:hypothetical protein
MLVGSILHAEENEPKSCENLKNSAYQIMLERQSGIKSLDLLESLLKPLDQNTESIMDYYYVNNFFTHVTGLAYGIPIIKEESEKQKLHQSLRLELREYV